MPVVPQQARRTSNRVRYGDREDHDADPSPLSNGNDAAMRTYSPRPSDIQRAWWVVDAEDVVLGRLATRVAHVLRGKHKPTFAPHLDTGDHVIVVNADKVRLTGRKAEQSHTYRHSGYPGGLSAVPFARLLAQRPDRLVEQAVRGMLPKNSVGRSAIRKLKVYAGPEHPHGAQSPQPLPEHLAV